MLAEDLVDDAHLQKVVSGAEGAELFFAALQRPVADRAGVCIFDAAAVLGPGQIGGGPESPVDRPAASLPQHLFLLLRRQCKLPGGADARRYMGVEGVDQLPETGPNIRLLEPGGGKAHPAVDVVADPAGRNDPGLPVKGGNAADGKSVPPVHVRHGQRSFDDPRQHRNVCHLLERFGLPGIVKHTRPGVNDTRHPHAAGAGNLPCIRADLLEVHRPFSFRRPLFCRSRAGITIASMEADEKGGIGGQAACGLRAAAGLGQHVSRMAQAAALSFQLCALSLCSMTATRSSRPRARSCGSISR